MAGHDVENHRGISPIGSLTERWPRLLAKCPWISEWSEQDLTDWAHLLDDGEKHLAGRCSASRTYTVGGVAVRDCRLQLPGRASGTWESAKCPTQLAEEVRAAVAVARLPRRHLKRLEDLEDSPALNALRRWIDGYEPGARGLLLAGPCGTGKTQLAVTAVYELLWRDRVKGKVLYTTAQGLIDALRDFDGAANAMREAVCGAEILLIDDIGSESLSDWGRGTLGDVLDFRYREVKTTILTTNLNRADLTAHLGERAVSRIAEMTDAIVLFGPDRRLQGKEGGTDDDE